MNTYKVVILFDSHDMTVTANSQIEAEQQVQDWMTRWGQEANQCLPAWRIDQFEQKGGSNG